MKTKNWLSGVAALLLAAGCGPPAVEVPKTPPAIQTPQPSPNPAPKGDAKQPADTNAQPDSASPPAKPAATDGGAAPAASTIEEIQSLARTNPTEAVAKLRTVLAGTPNDTELLTFAVFATQNLGLQAVQSGDNATAYPLMKESGELADKLLSLTNGDVPPNLADMIGTVFYNQACVAGIDKNAELAIKYLGKALEHGWTDVDKINNDSDLAVLHGTPELAKLIVDAESKLVERAAQKAKDELASFDSFPFDFNLAAIEGDGMLTMAEFKGKVMIIDIWGTWCPPCRAEIPHFVKLQEKYRDQGLQIVGLNKENGEPDEIKDKVSKFIAEYKMNYPCAIIDEATQDQVPEFQGYPTTLFLDRSGKVRLSIVGLHPAAELEAYIQVLLSEDV